MKSDFDAMVERYSAELLSQRRQWKNDGYIKDEPVPDEEDAKKELPLEDTDADDTKDTHSAQQTDSDRKSEGAQEAPSVQKEEPAEAVIPQDSSLFYARVFTGDSAYPLMGAKVVLRRDGQLVSFTVTDKNGETPKVKIPAYAKENSLEPFGENQRLDYLADVYMTGFTTKKDLLVSAVGGSVAVLDVQMSPVAERVE